MKKRILTTLLVLAIVVGAVFAVNAADTSPSITGVSLITENMETNGASLYYTMVYPCAQGDLDSIASYGVAMCLGGEPVYDGTPVDGKPTVMTEITDKSGWSNGVLTAKSSELRGILKASVSYDNNKSRANMPVYCQAYVKMTDGTIKTGNVVSFCLADVFAGKKDTYGNQATGVDTLWDSAWNYEKKAAVVEMQKLFKVLDTFGSDRLTQLFVSGETFEIKDAADLKIATNYPTHNFKLANNIDMSEVDSWTPFITYAGNFNGNGKTIENLTITPAANATSAGFFGTVTGTVTNLHLRNVTVNATNTKATAVGTIAGTNNGTITGVTATGYIKDTRKGTEAAPIYVGALVGKTTKAITVGTADLVNENELGGEQRKTIHLSGSTTVYADPGADYYKVLDKNGNVVNLAADVGFGNAQKDYVVTGLVGDGIVNGDATAIFWRDHSNSSAGLASTKYEHERRLTAAQHMNAMGSTAWKTPVKLQYIASSSDASHVQNQTFAANTTYYGAPYAHTTSSFEQMQAALSNGVLNQNIAKIRYNNTTGYGVFYNAKTTANSQTFEARTGVGQWFGNDCSSAIGMAWQAVAPAALNKQGIRILLTQNMVPSQVNQGQFGMETVGDYTVDDNQMVYTSGLWECNWGAHNIVDKTVAGYNYIKLEDVQKRYYTVTGFNDVNFPLMGTIQIVDATDEQTGERINDDTTIYESYAQTRLGDALVMAYPVLNHTAGTYSISGHALMAVGDPVTIRNANGDIDAAKSFMIVSEQGSGLYQSNLKSSWLVNTKYSYQMLLKGRTNVSAEHSTFSALTDDAHRGYLPITMKYFDYAGEIPAGVICKTNSTNPTVGTFDANYRFLNMKMKIWDYSTYGTTAPADENCVYAKTAWRSALPNGNMNSMRGISVPVYFTTYFSDYNQVFDAAAAVKGAAPGIGFGKGLTNGKTYAYTVTFTLSNGETVEGLLNTSGKLVNGNGVQTFTYAG